MNQPIARTVGAAKIVTLTSPERLPRTPLAHDAKIAVRDTPETNPVQQKMLQHSKPKLLKVKKQLEE